MCLIIIKKLIDNNIIMNDSMSILLATTILALGGLGLYMFKSDDDKEATEDEEYNEESLFGSLNLFNWISSDDDNVGEESVVEEQSDEDYKPRKRGSKTIKNRKTAGNSRRRY